MKNLQINVPDGYEVDKEKSTFENIVFKPKAKNIREQIQTMEDVYRLNGTTEKEFLKKWKGFEVHEIATAKEKLIVAAYNQGLKPDWSDGEEKKYYPYFNMKSFSFFDSCCYGNSCISSRFVFVGENAEENLEDAVSKFLDVYKESRLG